MEICCILSYSFASLAELDKLLFGLGDVVTCLKPPIKGFDKGCPCRGKGEGVTGGLVVRFDRLEIGDGPQSCISFQEGEG